MTEAVIFDMDGVIFDSERVSVKCWLEAGKLYGLDNDAIWKMKVKITGGNARNARRVANEEFAYIPGFDYDRFRGVYEEAYAGYLDRGEILLKAGARELLTWLHACGKKVGLATSTNRVKVMKQLKLQQVDHLFDTILCGDEVTKSKPDPEIYEKCRQRLGVPAEATFGVEDSYNGVHSICAAGMRAIMVPDILPVTEEMQALAQVILPNLMAVKDYLQSHEGLQEERS